MKHSRRSSQLQSKPGRSISPKPKFHPRNAPSDSASASRRKRPKFVDRQEIDTPVQSVDNSNYNSSSDMSGDSPLVKIMPLGYELSMDYDNEELSIGVGSSTSEIQDSKLLPSEDHISETCTNGPELHSRSESFSGCFSGQVLRPDYDGRQAVALTDDVISDQMELPLTDAQKITETQKEPECAKCSFISVNSKGPQSKVTIQESPKRRKLSSKSLCDNIPLPVEHSSQMKCNDLGKEHPAYEPQKVSQDTDGSNLVDKPALLAPFQPPSPICEHNHGQITTNPPALIANTTTPTTTTTTICDSNACGLHYELPNQKRFIEFLQSKGLPAKNFLELLYEKDLHQAWEGENESSEFESKLVKYVAHPRFSKINGPSKMPLQHKRLSANSELSTEAFLVDLWKLMAPGTIIIPNTANSELYQGPWFELVGYIGREWVTYFILHCCIYRPWDAGAEKWIDFTSPKFDWRLKSPETQTSIAWKKVDYVSKKNVMFHYSGLLKPQNSQIFRSSPILGINSLIQIVMKNVNRKWHKWEYKLADSSGIQGWIPMKKVNAFVESCLNEIFPRSLLGSQKNKCAFYKSVYQYIKAPGFKGTKVTALLKHIRLSEIPWLKAAEYKHEEKIYELNKLLKWIIEDVVNPLLGSYFYITEISGNPRTVYFYSHSVWIKKYLEPSKKCLIERLGGNESVEKVESHSNSGNWVRFVPKLDGSTRPIVNLKKFNERIKNAHLVLQKLIPTNQTTLKSWQEWVLKLYKFKDLHPHVNKYYVVQCDISGCYDNANVHKIKSLIKNLLDPSQGLFRIQNLKNYDCYSQNIKYSIAPILLSAADDTSKFFDINTVDKLHSHSWDLTSVDNEYKKHSRLSIVSETSFCHVAVERIAQAINDILNNLTLRLSKTECIPFKQGIPQGSACSLDLCNVLLDDLVVHCLNEYIDSDSCMLLRYVDDFLFITTDKTIAEKYFTRMREGFRHEYGVTCQEQKLFTNLNSSGEFMTYLGVKYNTDTLEVEPQTCSPFTLTLNGPNTAGNNADIAARLSIDMNRVLGLLRSFRRADMNPPAKLVWSVASVFGVALAHRFEAYCLLSERLNGSKIRNKVYSDKVNQFFMCLIPNDLRGRARKIINIRFNQEMKKLKKLRNLL